jgi:hypothetical protein
MSPASRGPRSQASACCRRGDFLLHFFNIILVFVLVFIIVIVFSVLHSSALSDTSHSSSNSSPSTQSADGSPGAEQFRGDKKMDAFAADLGVWAEGEAYCRWIEVEDSRVRTRRDVIRDVAESFRKLLLLPNNIFFAQLRMSKQTLYRLALLVKPLFVRSPNMRGRKPEPFTFALTYTIRCLAQGVSSWSSISVDWSVGESTMRGWIPQTCRVISEALPLPHQPVPSDTSAWQAHFDGVHAIRQARIAKNRG